MEHDEPDVPVAVLIDAATERQRMGQPEVHHVAVRGHNIDNVSPLLFDMLRSGCVCSNQFGSGPDRSGTCLEVVSECVDSPQLAFFRAPLTGRTPLHEACLRNSCRHILKALVQANPIAAMEQDNSGNTPLHLLFVDFSYLSVTPEDVDETVADLLAVNPSSVASAINADGSNPLHLACNAPDSMLSPSILRRLIEADPSCAARVNNKWQTPLSIHSVRRNASVDLARILYEAEPKSAAVVDHTGWAALHHAAQSQNTNLIRFLVENASESANIRNFPQGRTALHILCMQCPRDIHLPAIRALLDASPESVTVSDNVKCSSPLHIVCRGLLQRVSVVKLITETNHSVAAMTDNDGYNPLQHACQLGADVEIIRYLLSVYRAAATTVTRKQDTALHIACGANASAETIRLLVEANVDALTMTNDYGYTPMHCVCRAYQPKVGIVTTLLEACPSCVTLRTHGGETPVHLACSSGAFVSVLKILTETQNRLSHGPSSDPLQMTKPRMTNKVGNTPLHEACFRGASFEHIETLATANPEWIAVRNNAGYTPLQIVCKGGKLDGRIVNTFSRIRGPEVFSVVDSHGHTPLHSACREGTYVSAIRSLIQAYPEALHMQTSYGDLPLHLACLRGADVSIVCKVAEASSYGSVSPVLKPNSSGQTPLAIAMDEFQSVCRGTGFCCVTGNYRMEQERAFKVLSALVRLKFYKTSREVLSDETPTSLVKACVSLHRQDVRLDPAFIRRAIYRRPEEVRIIDEDGNYPLHIEASIPVEKMSLLDSQFRGCCQCHTRIGVLGMLIESFPEATQTRNAAGEFPLSLMIRNGRLWDRDFALALKKFPPALHWYRGMDDGLLPRILEKISFDCGVDTLYEFINTRPDCVRIRPR